MAGVRNPGFPAVASLLVSGRATGWWSHDGVGRRADVRHQSTFQAATRLEGTSSHCPCLPGSFQTQAIPLNARFDRTLGSEEQPPAGQCVVFFSRS